MVLENSCFHPFWPAKIEVAGHVYRNWPKGWGGTWGWSVGCFMKFWFLFQLFECFFFLFFFSVHPAFSQISSNCGQVCGARAFSASTTSSPRWDDKCCWREQGCQHQGQRFWEASPELPGINNTMCWSRVLWFSELLNLYLSSSHLVVFLLPWHCVF